MFAISTIGKSAGLISAGYLIVNEADYMIINKLAHQGGLWSEPAFPLALGSDPSNSLSQPDPCGILVSDDGARGLGAYVDLNDHHFGLKGDVNGRRFQSVDPAASIQRVSDGSSKPTVDSSSNFLGSDRR